MSHSARLQLDWLTCSRLLVVAGLLLASVYAAPKAAPVHLLFLLGAGVGLLVLRWPPAGLAALIAANQVVPFAIGTGTETSISITVLLLLVLTGIWLLSMLVRRDLPLLPSRPILPLLALVIVAVVAFLSGLQPWLAFADTAPLPAQIGGLMIFILSASAFLLVAHQVQNLRWLEWLTWLFVALGALYIAGRAVPTLEPVTSRVFQPGADSALFWIWLTAMAGGQALFNRSLGAPARLALAAVAVGTLGVGFVLVRTWISGWLPSLVVLVALLWLRSWRLGLLASIAGFAAVQLYQPDFLADLITLKEYSADTRREAWLILIGQVIPASPILGLGPANYHAYTPFFSFYGYFVRFNSHNNYLDLVAQTGILGLGCFLWFAVEIGLLGWRLRSQYTTGFGCGYTHGALAGLAATLVSAQLGDWVLPFVYNVGLKGFRGSVMGWLFLGGLVALERIGNWRAVSGDGGAAVVST